MQKLLSIILFILVTAPLLTQAQCTPDPNENTRGAYPLTLAKACVNAPYDQTITVVAPVDTIYGGFTVPMDSMKINNLNNLPFGFSATCGSTNCTGYPPNFAEPAKHCIQITGTATNMFSEDTIFIPVTYYATIFGFPTPIEDELFVLLETSEPDTSVTVVGTTLISQASSATYQWLDCNNGMSPILNATGPSFTVVESGSYAVEVTQNGCAASSSCYTVSSLSVNDLLKGEKINVFPNPTDGILNIDLQNISQPVHVRVFDAVGALVYQDNLKGSRLEQFQLNLPNGVYSLELSTKHAERMHTSFVVQTP